MYIFLQKNYTFLFCILAVITAVAQQWAGSTTTTDTITRFGVSEIIPDKCSLYRIGIEWCNGISEIWRAVALGICSFKLRWIAFMT